MISTLNSQNKKIFSIHVLFLTLYIIRAIYFLFVNANLALICFFPIVAIWLIFILISKRKEILAIKIIVTIIIFLFEGLSIIILIQFINMATLTMNHLYTSVLISGILLIVLLALNIITIKGKTKKEL